MSSSPQTRYELVIDTNQYSGNFERELVSYMFGCVDENNVGLQFAEYDPEGRQNLIWAYDPTLDAYDDHVLQQYPHEEYPEFVHWSAIVPTPGWYNVQGVHHRLKPGESAPADSYPAYNSVVMRLAGLELTALHAQQLRERAAGFPKAHALVQDRIVAAFRNKPEIVIEDVRLTKITETFSAVTESL